MARTQKLTRDEVYDVALGIAAKFDSPFQLYQDAFGDWRLFLGNDAKPVNPPGQTLVQLNEWMLAFERGINVTSVLVAQGKYKPILDQDGEPVPTDLVFLNLVPGELSDDALKKIRYIDWYRVDARRYPKFHNSILVSAAALSSCIAGVVDFTSPKHLSHKEIRHVCRVNMDRYRYDQDHFYFASGGSNDHKHKK